ncbi:MAG: UvrD-helicase domain-containing protein [Bacteroidaceae bacterium]|nr:UvrD-helicase domain-containing protein [Bacteroidaceae bacterium]
MPNILVNESNPSQPHFMDRLNDQQRVAVECTEGPSLVVAGAGSGKTTVLTTKIAYLLTKGVAPWNILALTFTNKAAREMRERIEQMVGVVEARSLWMGTFHSIFSRILRKEAFVFGFDSQYTIYQPSDTRSLLKAIVRERGLDDKVYKPQLLAANISQAKNMLVTPKRYRQSNEAYTRDDMERIPLTGEIYEEYFNRCHKANAMDFDDLLLYTFLLFDAHPEIREKYASKFRYILVDEFQDTNYAQFVILDQLARVHKNICVVGDDAQSIYSFRGARIDNILNYDRVFAGTKVFKLERNYRSTQNIVNAANSLIQHNENQIRKTIYSENEEGSPLILNELTSDIEEGAAVCQRIKTLHREGVKYSEMAILYRTNGQSRILEESLRKNSIPYIIYGSNSFYEKKEIRDVMGYLRLIVNPNDEEALRRIINFPTRGIGDTTVNKIFNCAQEHGTSAWNVVQQPDLYGLDANAGTKSRLQAFAAMIRDFVADLNGADAYQLGQRVLKESGLMEQAIADRSTEGKEVMDNYSSLLSGMSQFVQSQREQDEGFSVGMIDYLQEVALLTDSDKDEGDGDAVRMMTVHIAKGLEFDVVFVTGLEQGIFPSAQCLTPKEHEEERRLLFVAITRARKRCYVSNAKTRFRFGKSDWFEPSEFLKDIDSKYIYQETSSRDMRRQNFNEYIDFDEERNALFKPRSTYRTHQEYRPQKLRSASVSYNRPLKALRSQGRGTAPAELQTARVQNGIISAGSRVEHATFGVGTVLRIEDNMTGLKAVINFVNCGEKTLLLKYAKLNIID